MLTVTLKDGRYVCPNCAATAEPKHKARFMKRHPALCTKRKEFTKQLAAGTRSVDAEELMDRGEEFF